jgi:hypothetical protein
LNFSWTEIGEKLNLDPFLAREMYHKAIQNQEDELSATIQNLGAFSNPDEIYSSDDDSLLESLIFYSFIPLHRFKTFSFCIVGCFPKFEKF